MALVILTLTHFSVEDPRIIWPDSASIGFDGYFYMNINQVRKRPEHFPRSLLTSLELFDQADWNFGVDLRTKPGAMLRFKLPNNGTKIMTLGDPVSGH